ncbi:MAG: GtrA family protein [Bryobacteraceae bacterium]|nr:GtrA family protein [Bryobacteraceae bacterium]
MTTEPSRNAERPYVRAARVTLMFVSQNRGKLLRWFAAGLAFMGISTALLYGSVELLGLSVPIATLLTAEASTLLRFLVNHYWVFGLRNPTIRNCIEYHVANAGAFALWWITANALTLLGMHYLLAGIAAVACSTLFSLSTNFLWIWRKRHPPDQAP